MTTVLEKYTTLRGAFLRAEGRIVSGAQGLEWAHMLANARSYTSPGLHPTCFMQ